MLKILKASVVVSMATVVTILVGVIRAKFTALTLGPDGVGIFSQANNFVTFAVTIGSLCVGAGVAKYISQYAAEKNDDMVRHVVSYSLWMQFFASLFIVLLITILSRQWSNFLFCSSDYALPLIILSLGVPFLTTAITSESTMLGLGNCKGFAKAKSLAALFSILPLFIFVGLLGVKGGFLYLAVNAILTFSVYLYIVQKSIPWNILTAATEFKNFFRKDDNGIRKNLLSYGGVSFINSTIGLFTMLYLRANLIKRFGPEGNGFYQVVFAISAYYIPFFTNGIWYYFYPKISATKQAEEKVSELNKSFRFCVFGIVPIIVGLFICRDLIIRLMYSEKFIYSRQLFATQLSGDLFYLLFFLFCTSLLAEGRLKPYLAIGAAYNLIFIISFFMLSSHMQTKAITTSYLFTNLISFLMLYLYYVKRIRVKLDSENLTLLLSATTIIFICLFLGPESYIYLSAKIILIICWLLLMLTYDEKKSIYEYAYGKYRRVFR